MAKRFGELKVESKNYSHFGHRGRFYIVDMCYPHVEGSKERGTTSTCYGHDGPLNNCVIYTSSEVKKTNWVLVRVLLG